MISCQFDITIFLSHDIFVQLIYFAIPKLDISYLMDSPFNFNTLAPKYDFEMFDINKVYYVAVQFFEIFLKTGC